jgi:hypothetical protein
VSRVSRRAPSIHDLLFRIPVLFVFVHRGSVRKPAYLSYTGDRPCWISLAGKSNAGASVFIHHMHRRYRATYHNAQLPLSFNAGPLQKCLAAMNGWARLRSILVGSTALHLSAATRCPRLSRHIANYLASSQITQSMIDSWTLNFLASPEISLTGRLPAPPPP